MTGDQELRGPAQHAIRFIVSSQEPTRGGWRYSPGQMSDLSVSGWQLMALRSGQLAGLEVPTETIEATQRLLDRAQPPRRTRRNTFTIRGETIRKAAAMVRGQAR